MTKRYTARFDNPDIPTTNMDDLVLLTGFVLRNLRRYESDTNHTIQSRKVSPKLWVFSNRRGNQFVRGILAHIEEN